MTIDRLRPSNFRYRLAPCLNTKHWRTDKLTNKLIYNSSRNKVSKKPTAEKKVKQFIGDNDLTLVYGMPFKITKSTKLQYFQFKINHGYFPTNRYLNKVNKLDTNFCQYCDIDDNIEH